MKTRRKPPSSRKSRARALAVALLVSRATAHPASLPFSDCLGVSGTPVDAERHITVSTVYSQIANYGSEPVIKYTVLGTTAGTISGASPTLLGE